MALLSGPDFPRGGKRSYKENKADHSGDLNLFQTEDGESQAKKRKVSVQPKVKKHKVRSKKKELQRTRTKPHLVEPLTFKNMTEGMLVLGLVKEVQDYKLMVSLPCGLFGVVSITDVSQAYTQKLQAVAESAGADEDMVSEEVPSLRDLFCVGDALPCRVLTVKMEGMRRRIDLSVDPKEVNKDVPLTSLKNGSLLYGVVNSVEEHGYMIDLGLPGIQAFLQTDDQQHGIELPVGKGIWCTLETEAGLELVTGETRVVRVSVCSPGVQQAQVTSQMVTSVECLRPGMLLAITVEKVLDSGLRVKCLRYGGSIHKSHVPQGLGQYCVGQQLEARILYTHPVSKAICLTLLPGIVQSVGREGEEEMFADLSVGDVIEDAEVLFVDKELGVYFKFQHYRASASLQNLSDDKRTKDINQTFPRGSIHKCRIIGFHPADDIVLVSLKESVMHQKFLTMDDIHPGQIVEGTVQDLHTSGLIVSLAKNITGLVPKLHIADVPLKHFEKKFAKGDKLKCRVLKVDAKKNRLLLSNKKSLVTTSLCVPVSYEGLSADTQVEGCISYVKDQGVVVSFCNGVTGWVPRLQLSMAEISDPKAVFYVGQVVRCRVLSCQPDSEKLRLSLIISGKTPLGRRQNQMENFEVGKLLEAEVVVKRGNNVEVKLQPSGVKALLPKHHLADSADNQELLWRSLEVGKAVGTVMLYKQTDSVIVTKKESFISAAREDLIPKSFSDLQPGQLLPGVVKNHQTYGIFVELPGGLSGLVPRKFTMDRPIPDLTTVFACGQSVMVKVIEVKQENSRFLCSLRMCDCFHDDPSIGTELLETYLDERAACLDSLLDEKAQKLKPGSLVMVEVTEVTSDGYLCQTDWGLAATLAPRTTAEAELEVGSRLEAVVLHVNPVTMCLDVSADRTLVHTVSRRAEKPNMDKARVGQRIKAEVVLVKEDFVLVALKQHAAGILAYVPTKQHVNDVLVKDLPSVGEQTHVIIQRSDAGRVLANLEVRVPEAMMRKGKLVHARHELQLGQLVTAQVQAIHASQMNVKIGNVSGRVHVTEMADKVEDGTCVFAGYTKGQDVTVKIIGFRHLRSLKYLPISHPRLHKAMPDCTLKSSKLDRADCPSEDLASFKHQYKIGEKVLVFPIKFENNKLWVNVSATVSGVISVFDLSRDLGVLRHAEKHFLAGHGYLATVLGVEEEGLLHLSLTGKKEMVKKNKVVTGKVTSVTNKGIFLRLPGDFRGCVPLADGEMEKDGDSTHHLADVAVGDFVRCRVLSCKEKDKCVLAAGARGSPGDSEKIAPNVPSVPQPSLSGGKSETSTRKRKRDVQLPVLQKEEHKTSLQAPTAVSECMSSTSTSVSGQQHHNTPASTPQQPQQAGESGSTESPRLRLRVSDEFRWEEPPKSADTVDRQESSDDDTGSEDEDQEPKKKKKKRETGSQEMATNSSDMRKDFDKLLMSRPNDSMLWIEYMSEHLNAGDIDRAKAVGEQALKTISFREEQDKMNVWIALLNLENLYGSKDQVTQTFHRALQVSDPLTLFRRVAAMYTASGKMEEAEHTYQAMVRKFKQTKQAWADFGLFLYKQGRLDAARNLLQRSLLSLERRDHVDMIAKFAQMEFGHGEPERGATMFEKIMAEFPRRSDIMSVFIDMVIKSGDPDRARELFERAVTNMKNAKFFFKKYLAFEEKYGTEGSVARVKDKIASCC